MLSSRAVNQLNFYNNMQISQAAMSHKTGDPGVKYQPENERPNRPSEIGAAQGVLIIFLANRIGDRHE